MATKPTSPTRAIASAAVRTLLTQTTAENGYSYLIRRVAEDDHTAMLELVEQAPGNAERRLHADTALFPLPLNVNLPRDAEQALAEGLIASELRPGDDVVESARRLVLGLPTPTMAAGDRGIFDFLFGNKPADVPTTGDLNARLHQTAVAQVEVLDSGHAPGTNGGHVACVWAVNQIHLLATGRRLTTTLATAVLYEELNAGLGSPVDAADLEPGDLIISPTEGGHTGHVGIVGSGQGGDRLVYSNSSAHHVWRRNYTVGSWRSDIAEARGLKLAFFRLRAPDAPRRLERISFPRMMPAPMVVTAAPTVPAKRPKSKPALKRGGGRSVSLDDLVNELPESPEVPESGASLPSPMAAPSGDRAQAHLAGIYRVLGVTSESMRSSRALSGRGLFGPSSGHRWLVAEGDSWFDYSYPQPSNALIGHDLLDGLRDFGHDIENVGTAGAAVQDMAFGPDDDSIFDFFNRDDTQLLETVKWVLRRRPRAFLLSGGGNDFAGDGFEDYLNPADGGQPGINEAAVDRLMSEVTKKAYTHIITVVKQAAADHGIHSDLPVFLHGYANAFPDGRRHMIGVGPWLAPGFEIRGYHFDPNSPQAAQQLRTRQRIVTEILERFRATLRELAAELGNVFVADFTQELTHISDWQNELHPTNAGFDRVASIMNQLIESKLGPVPERALIAGEMLGDEHRFAEAGLIAEFDQARRAFEDDDLHGALALLNSAETRRRDDTSTLNAALSGLPPEVVDRDRARWLNLGDALAGLLHHQPTEAAAGGGASPGTGGGTGGLDFASLKPGYVQLWTTISLRPEKAESIRQMTDLILRGRAEYAALESDLGVPWFFTGIIHALEGSCRFTTHLHNGDPLTARTVHEPVGRPTGGHPPFAWRESARDALIQKGYHNVTDWSVPAMLWRWERYNGFGYRRASVNIPSPYLWSFSTHYVKGKYVSDGHYNPDAVSAQVGAAVLLKALVLRGEVNL